MQGEQRVWWFATARLLTTVLVGQMAPRVEVARNDLLPRAPEIARLAAQDVSAGRLLKPEEAIPVYLRDDVAHVPGVPASPPASSK